MKNSMLILSSNPQPDGWSYSEEKIEQAVDEGNRNERSKVQKPGPFPFICAKANVIEIAIGKTPYHSVHYMPASRDERAT